MKQFEQSYEKLKAFEKWWNIIGQYEFSTYLTKEQSKSVWKAALEWVLNNRKPYYTVEDKKVVATDSDIIYEELEATK